MDKKTIYIGLGILAVAGIAYFLMKKKPETTSGATRAIINNAPEQEKIDSIKNAKLENKKQNLHGGYYGEETSSLRRKDGERSGNDCWSASNNMWVDCKKK